MGSWYETGFGGIGREEQRLASMGGLPRLWMPPGSTREVVFVPPAESVNLYEHGLRINGQWKGNQFTCLKGIDDGGCPICEEAGENTRYYVGMFTVVDTSAWTDRRGNKHQFEITLLPCKFKSLKKFRRKAQERVDSGGTGLAGCMYRLARDGKEDPQIGSEAEFVREVDLQKLFALALFKGKKLSELMDKADVDPGALAVLQKLFAIRLGDDGKVVRELVPFNYFEQLQPLSRKQLQEAIRGFDRDVDKDRGGDGGSGGGEAKADSSVPF